MKKIQVIENLKNALEHTEELIKASEGNNSRCSCKDFKAIKSYVESWIKSPIEEALTEIEK